MKKIIRIVLFSLILVCLLIFVKASLTPVLMKNANYGLSALKNKQGVTNVFVGSSMFRQGIDTESLGEGNYLLSYNGNQPFAEYYEVKELLESGVMINRLYVDMYAYSMTADVSLSDTKLLQDMPFSFIPTLYGMLRKYGQADFADLFEMSVQANNEVFFTWPVSYPLINSRYQNGASTVQNAGATAEKLEQLPVDFTNTTELNEIQCSYMEKLIYLCEEYQVVVVFVETPKYEKMYRENDYCEIMKNYLNFLSKYDCVILMAQKTAECLPEESKRCVTYFFEHEEPSYFSDLIHMSYDGRKIFSEVLKVTMDSEWWENTELVN